MNLSADKLQQITFNLCWIFARALTPISYAAPAYYADRLAERGRSYIAPLLTPGHWARPTVRELLNGLNVVENGPNATTLEEMDLYVLDKIKRGWVKPAGTNAAGLPTGVPDGSAAPHWVDVRQRASPMVDGLGETMFYI